MTMADDSAPALPPTSPALDCPHAPPCPGCPLIPLDYGQQLERKHAELVGVLAGVVPAAAVRPVVAAPRLAGYRNQSRLVFTRGRTGRIELGLYAAGTHRVVAIPRCPIQPEGMNAIARSIGRMARELRLLVYHERSRRGHLRYGVIRCDRTRRRFLVGLVAARDADDPRLRTLAKGLREAHPEIIGITLLVNTSPGNIILAGEERWTTGAARLPDRIGQANLLVSMRSFLQANHDAADWICARIVDRVGNHARGDPAGVVLDLYSGVGAIAMNLAAAALRVVAVEESATAVADAEAGRRLASLPADRIRFIAASVEQFLADPHALAPELAGVPLTATVVNPPRAGVSPRALAALSALAPPLLIYVSCRPATLARDLAHLGPDYATEEITPVDMLPLTPHIEALAVLVRRAGVAARPHHP